MKRTIALILSLLLMVLALGAMGIVASSVFASKSAVLNPPFASAVVLSIRTSFALSIMPLSLS